MSVSSFTPLAYTPKREEAKCSADMLSMVQSSIGAGQDPSQTLSRLMDWAEAREVSVATSFTWHQHVMMCCPASAQ